MKNAFERNFLRKKAKTHWKNYSKERIVLTLYVGVNWPGLHKELFSTRDYVMMRSL